MSKGQPPAPDYSTLEVDEGAQLPEPYKQKNDHELPEAINTTGKEVVGPATPASRKPTICGLRRKLFWIALAVAALVIVGVGVGVGLGVGLTRNRSSSSAASSTSDSSTANSTVPYRQGVAANSHLAANNYTDASGVVHSQLYYQENSLDIWNADFNNSTARWSLAPVRADNNRTDMTPKNGTPIAAGNWWHDNNDGLADFRVFWVDDSSMIRAVFVLNESVATSGWSTLSQLDAWIPVDATSQLVEYLPMCNQNTTCNSADFVGFESPNSEGVRLQWPFANGDNGRLVADGGVPADAGTAMAVAPIPKIAKRNDSYPTVALYLVGGGALVELRGGAFIDWENTNLEVDGSHVTVDSGAQLAALSQYKEDDYNVQVLMSQTNGGVKMAYMNGDGWNSTDSVEGMENVLPLSPIAANQLGWVYAMENGTDGRAQIVEWQRITGSMPSFERVGVVDTTGNAV